MEIGSASLPQLQNDFTRDRGKPGCFCVQRVVARNYVCEVKLALIIGFRLCPKRSVGRISIEEKGAWEKGRRTFFASALRDLGCGQRSESRPAVKGTINNGIQRVSQFVNDDFADNGLE